MCSSYHGPSRSPIGRLAALSIAATTGPYIVSLSRSAGGGTREATRIAATVLLPDPGGPATTHAAAGPLMRCEDTACAPPATACRVVMRLPCAGLPGPRICIGKRAQAATPAPARLPLSGAV